MQSSGAAPLVLHISLMHYALALLSLSSLFIISFHSFSFWSAPIRCLISRAVVKLADRERALFYFFVFHSAHSSSSSVLFFVCLAVVHLRAARTFTCTQYIPAKLRITLFFIFFPPTIRCFPFYPFYFFLSLSSSFLCLLCWLFNLFSISHYYTCLSFIASSRWNVTRIAYIDDFLGIVLTL